MQQVRGAECVARENTERPDERLRRSLKWIGEQATHSDAMGNDDHRGRVLEIIAREVYATLRDTERPDGDSHWATVVIDDAFEPRELTEAESVLLYDSGIGIDVERMWIRPGVPDTEQEPK